MSIHLSRAVEILKRKVLMLATLIEESVADSVNSVEKHDSQLAQKVIQKDDKIDQMEIDVEEECLKILALHQPVAIDLRFIVAVLKLNNDLERIGDLAAKIAEQALLMINGNTNPALKFDFSQMYECTCKMLKNSLDSLIRMDTRLAYQVSASDHVLDEMHRKMYLKVKEGILNYPQYTDMFLQYLSISRSLERIGDHATNIAEDVVYMAEAKIIRHSAEVKNAQLSD